MPKIKKLLTNLIKNQLITGSAVLFIGSMVGSFGNYLYHLLMGRMLGPSDYGTLASLISLAYLLGIPMSTVSLVVVKFVSEFRGKKDLPAVNFFYYFLNRKVLLYSLGGFFLFFIFSPLVASFLHLEDNFSLWLVGLTSLLGIFLSINLSVLQGFLRFGWNTVSGLLNVIVKLVLAVLLVYLNFKVLGAVAAMLVGQVVGFGLSIFYARKLIGQERRRAFSGAEVVTYALPVFFSILSFTSLYTTDVVLAKHFLSAQDAGFYAALATLGKIVFFAASPIITAMFPMVSERHANGKGYQELLKISLGLVSLVCVGLGAVYLLFPKLMIKILFGREYLLAAPHLWLFAIFLALYSFSYLLVNFYLSIKKERVVLLPVAAAVLQIILIGLFHQTLLQVVGMSIVSMTLLFLSLLGYSFLKYE